MADLRCGVVGTKIIWNDRTGKLKGFNGGCISRTEQMHPAPYSGCELYGAVHTDNNPFGGEIVTKPEAINLRERKDGKVILTNTFISEMTDEDIENIIDRAIEHHDRPRIDIERISLISMAPELKKTLEQPEQQDIISIWNNWNFELVSLSEHGSEILKILYQEMKDRNVAISRGNSYLFDGRPGLSFVVVSELTPEELAKKEEIEKGKTHEPCENRETRGPYGASTSYIEAFPTDTDGEKTIRAGDLKKIAITQRKGRIARWIERINNVLRGKFKTEEEPNETR